jgi:hypothetical protein
MRRSGMGPQPKRVCSLETVWIREFAKTYMPSEAGLTYSPQNLRDAGISVIGIRNVLRRAHVVFADKLDGPGARWVIEGDNNDGERFRLTATVITEQLAVDLSKVEKLSVPVKVEEKSDGHDAA